MEPRKADEKSKQDTYDVPKIVDVGAVEELTHGSREQTADDGSGYKGG